MRIIFDTSVVVSEGYFRSGTMRALVKAAHYLGWDVLMPDVVWDELLGKVEKEIISRADAYNASARRLNAVTGKNIELADARTEFSEYEDWLTHEIDKFAIRLIPYPETTTKELVTKSYEGIKPFNDNGTGHKDYLIWRSIIEFLTIHSDFKPTLFLTKNTKDFCETTSQPFILHSDLASQIPRGHSVEVFQDISTVFKTLLSPHLKGLNINDIPDDLLHQANTLIETTLTHYTTFGFEGVPLDDITISYVENVEVVCRSIQALDDDEFLVTFDCTADVEIDGFIEKSVYYSTNLDISIWEPDLNKWVMGASTNTNLPVRVIFTYAKREGGITGSDVELPTEISPFDY